MRNENAIIFTETNEGARTYDLMPPYSHDGIKFMYDELFHNKPHHIADIGSGTGLLTAQIMQNNVLYGVEPDPNMRMVAEEKFHKRSNFNSIIGTAENTNLPTNSMDFITVGQAFHRFDPTSFRAEADRILKNDDNVIILWNRIYYDRPIFNDLLSAIKGAYSGYACRFVCQDEVEGSLLELHQNDQIAFDFYHGNAQKKTFSNPFSLSAERFMDICLSLWIFPLANGQETQKILQSDEFDLVKFKREISEIFAIHQNHEIVTLPLETDIYFP